MKQTQKKVQRLENRTVRAGIKATLSVVCVLFLICLCVWGYCVGAQSYRNRQTLQQIHATILGALRADVGRLYADKTITAAGFNPHVVNIRRIVADVAYNGSAAVPYYDTETQRELESFTTPTNVPVWVRAERPDAFTVRMTGVSYEMCKQLVQSDTGYAFAYVVPAGQTRVVSDLTERFPAADLLVSENAVDRLCLGVDATRGTVAPVQSEIENAGSKVERLADKMAVYPTLVLYYGVWENACAQDTVNGCFEKRNGLCFYKETGRAIGCGCASDSDCDTGCSGCENGQCVARADASESCVASVFLPNPDKLCQTDTVLDMAGNETPYCCQTAGYHWTAGACCVSGAPYSYAKENGASVVTQACCAAFAGTDEARARNNACCLNGAEYETATGAFSKQTENCCMADGGVWSEDNGAGTCCLAHKPLTRYGDGKTLDTACCLAAGGNYLSADTDKGFSGAPLCCKGGRSWEEATGDFTGTDARCPAACDAGETSYCATEETVTEIVDGIKTIVQSKCTGYACCPANGLVIADKNKPQKRRAAVCYVPEQSGRPDVSADELTPYCATYDVERGLCAAYSICRGSVTSLTFGNGQKLQLCSACVDTAKQVFAPETFWNQVCVVDSLADRTTVTDAVLNIETPVADCCAHYSKRADRKNCACLQNGGQVMADGSCCLEGGVTPALADGKRQWVSYCGTLVPLGTVCGCAIGAEATVVGNAMSKDLAPGTCGAFPIAAEGVCCPYACNDPENGGTKCCTQGSVNQYCCDWKCAQQKLSPGDKCVWDSETKVCQFCYYGDEGK